MATEQLPNKRAARREDNDTHDPWPICARYCKNEGYRSDYYREDIHVGSYRCNSYEEKSEKHQDRDDPVAQTVQAIEHHQPVEVRSLVNVGAS